MRTLRLLGQASGAAPSRSLIPLERCQSTAGASSIRPSRRLPNDSRWVTNSHRVRRNILQHVSTSHAHTPQQASHLRHNSGRSNRRALPDGNVRQHRNIPTDPAVLLDSYSTTILGTFRTISDFWI